MTTEVAPARTRTFPTMHPSKWPSGDLYFCDATDTTESSSPGATTITPPLPLGVPVPFETDLFRGRILLRIRNVRPMDGTGRGLLDPHHDAYFAGKKRLYQMVVQGQFKVPSATTAGAVASSSSSSLSSPTPLTFERVVLGARYDRPFTGIPGRNTAILRCIQRFVQRINPGMVFDIAADRPKIMTPIGTCQTLRVDVAGEEPDITDPRGILEDTTRMVPTTNRGAARGNSSSNDDDNNNKKNNNSKSPFVSAKQRRERLAKPKYASRYAFDPNLVYTFENYDDTMDLGTYHQLFGRPGGLMSLKVDLADKLNGQPLSLTAMVKDTDRIVFDFHLWHERLWHNVMSVTNNVNDTKVDSKDDSEVDVDTGTECSSVISSVHEPCIDDTPLQEEVLVK